VGCCDNELGQRTQVAVVVDAAAAAAAAAAHVSAMHPMSYGASVVM